MSAQPWFADKGTPFNGNEPYFFASEEHPWVAKVESQWAQIRDELKAHLAQGQAQLVPYIDKEMTSRPNRWKTLGLMFWGRASKNNCAQFPTTWSILKDVPNLAAVSFNSLDANTTIKPHFGNTNAIIRTHLGLVVPDSAPRCGFRVGTETRSWEEGKFLMFCDAYEHTAWNNTDQERFILVVDVFRSDYVAQAESISSRVLAGIYFDAAYQQRAWLRRFFSAPWARSLVFTVMRAYYRLTQPKVAK